MTRFAFVLFCSLAAIGCAKTRMEAGTDGATHFLNECERDAQCGELSCLCGVCTKACERDDQCSALSGDAECASAMSCDDAASGHCVRSSDAGAGAGGSAGTGGSGGSGPSACAPVDARSNGDDCLNLLGYTWNGTACDEVQCGCTGSACDALYSTRARCEIEHAECAPPCSRMDANRTDLDCATPTGYRWTGVACELLVCGCIGEDCDLLYETQDDCEQAHRECAPLTMCTTSTDCDLVEDRCCGTCGELQPSDLVSIAQEQVPPFYQRICEVGRECLTCDSNPEEALKRVAAVCNPSTRWEGGECGKVAIDSLACTEDVGCRVRARRCCECGIRPDISVDELFAMPNDYDAESLFCDLAEDCCEAEAEYPSNVEARCEQSRCALYLDGELLR